MELAAYLTTVLAVCGIALGAMYMIVTLLGKRIDDLVGRVDGRFDDMDRRFDDARTGADQRFDAVERRMDRLEAQNDSIIGAVSDLGQRVTRLETRHAS